MRPKIAPKQLNEIATGFNLANYSEASDSAANEVFISGITHNSKEVLPGDIFVALPGANYHGQQFIPQALINGAVAIATDQVGLESAMATGLPVITLTTPRVDMAILAARVYDHPEKKLTLVGVTGTNGKTSVTHILQSIFSQFGFKVGVIGTVGTYLDGQHLSGVRTTPESTDLYAILALMAQQEITHVFMEVSSHALAQDRVHGLQFTKAIFTNLSQDHLDFHGTMENYFAAKAKLFTPEFAKSAVICIEDSWGEKLVGQTSIPKTTVSQNKQSDKADWAISDLRLAVTQTDFVLSHQHQDFSCSLPMIGAFNATNAAVAVVVATELGLDPQLVCRQLTQVAAVPGRSQLVTHNSPGTAIVDYAHTPEAVEKVLATLREVCAGQLITVIGCGGDRDATKRPIMGKVAAEISDVVIVTDDNPRSEDPAKIRAAVLAGINAENTEVLEIGDRRQAIKQALAKASHADIVAVLGKGHEQGQEIAGQIFPFDDVQVIQQEAN